MNSAIENLYIIIYYVGPREYETGARNALLKVYTKMD